MPRAVLARGLVALVLALTTVPAATAAHAGWSRPGDLVTYRICKQSTADGERWVLRNRVRKPAGTPDARASMSVHRKSRQVARRTTGWLEGDEVATYRVRVRKGRSVRIYVQQEAGDRDSAEGTSAEAVVLKPRRIAHCG